MSEIILPVYVTILWIAVPCWLLWQVIGREAPLERVAVPPPAADTEDMPTRQKAA